MSLENLSGQTLGQYELRELLGVGGMGAVYRAYQPSLRREVAVKVLPPALIAQSDDTARFNREAEVAAALEHPHIVPIVDHGTVRGTSYIVMRLLTGGTLADRLIARRGSPPSLGEINEILKQLAGALAYAHNRNVIHRDLKPTNVMFDDSGNAYLVDFGIAKILDASIALTNLGVAMGTPTYMAPEQWRGRELSHATDQYALAGMIYQLITGQPPFEAPTRDSLMYKHLEETPTPVHTIREGIPEQVTNVLLRAMAKDEKQRYGSITAFAQAFEVAIAGNAGEPTQFLTFRLPPRATKGVRTPSRPSPIARSTGSSTVELVKRNPLIAGVAALIVLLVALAIFLLGQGSASSPNLAAAAQTLQAFADSQTAIAQASVAASPALIIYDTETPSNSPEPTETHTSSPEPAVIRVLDTETPLPTATDTATATATETSTLSPAPSATFTETATAPPTETSTATPEPSHTPLPVIRILDTETPTPTASETDAPAAPPTPDRPRVRVIQGANIRISPDTTISPPIGSMGPGEESDLLARNPAGDWYKIRFNNGEGWVAAVLVETIGDVTILPIDIGPPTSTATPDLNATLAVLLEQTRAAAATLTQIAVPTAAPSPTPNIPATLDALATATEAALQTHAALDATAIATLWTATPSATWTPTQSPTMTPTVTSSPSVTQTAIALNATSTPTLAPTAANAQIIVLGVENAGDVNAEGVRIRNIGNTVDLTGWRLVDSGGNEYVFAERLLFSNQEITIYTRIGTDTPVAYYWNLDRPVWESSDVLTLFDRQGNVQATSYVEQLPHLTQRPPFALTTATPTVDVVMVAQTLAAEQTALAFIEQVTQTAISRDATAVATLWTATPSATWTPSQTSTLTPSPTVTPSPTAPPSPTPTPQPASLPAARPTLVEARTVRSVVILGSTGVNLRSGPSTNSSRVTTVDPGDRFVVEEVQSGPDPAGTWYRVRLEDGRNAWVRGDLVRFEEVKRVDWTPVEREFDGVPMVLVPAGCFQMGSNNGDSDERPVHEQCFDAPFWIDKTEVTQAQFRRLGGTQANPRGFSGDNRPVESITWFEARDFCEQRGGRLPTEAEWEYAARGPGSWLYPWGNTWNGNNAVWNRSDSQGTANVGSIPAGASWVGALDMIGNVWEWTSSLYEPYPYDAQDGRERDTGSDTDIPRVLRGGSWGSDDSNYLRAPIRDRINPVNWSLYYGFRCARSFE